MLSFAAQDGAVAVGHALENAGSLDARAALRIASAPADGSEGFASYVDGAGVFAASGESGGGAENARAAAKSGAVAAMNAIAADLGLGDANAEEIVAALSSAIAERIAAMKEATQKTLEEQAELEKLRARRESLTEISEGDGEGGILEQEFESPHTQALPLGYTSKGTGLAGASLARGGGFSRSL